MKTVLITGCSSGIGYATALYFAREGFRVIATMRDMNKSNNLREKSNIEKLNIDIGNLMLLMKASFNRLLKIF